MAYPNRLWWGQWHSAGLNRDSLHPPVPAWERVSSSPRRFVKAYSSLCWNRRGRHRANISVTHNHVWWRLGESLENPSFKCKTYKYWNLPSREGNSVTYPVCHLAEIPRKGQVETTLSILLLSFCFDRKASNLATATQLEGNKSNHQHTPLRTERGQAAGATTI